MTSNKSSGISFFGALFLLFLALRLTDHIDWAWYWIGAPLWMPLALVIVLRSIEEGLLHLDRRAERKKIAKMAPDERERYLRWRRTLDQVFANVDNTKRR